MSKLKFKKYKCFNCNYPNKFHETIYRTKLLRQLYTVNLCKKCNCEFTNKIPANNFTWREIYKLGGSDKQISKNDKNYNFLTNIFYKLRIFQIKKIEKIINRHSKRKKLIFLDYGAGDGYVSNYFNKDDNIVYSSDINSGKPTYLNLI